MLRWFPTLAPLSTHFDCVFFLPLNHRIRCCCRQNQHARKLFKQRMKSTHAGSCLPINKHTPTSFLKKDIYTWEPFSKIWYCGLLGHWLILGFARKSFHTLLSFLSFYMTNCPTVQNYCLDLAQWLHPNAHTPCQNVAWIGTLEMGTKLHTHPHAWFLAKYWILQTFAPKQLIIYSYLNIPLFPSYLCWLTHTKMIFYYITYTFELWTLCQTQDFQKNFFG